MMYTYGLWNWGHIFYIFPWGGEKKRQVHITFSYKVYVVLTDSRKYSESDTYGFWNWGHIEKEEFLFKLIHNLSLA